MDLVAEQREPEPAAAATPSTFDVDRYLAHLGYEGSREPTLQTLTDLQVAHLMRVPFENLHVFHRRGVRVDLGWSYGKIVGQSRGGWCFELNGCFSELLRRLGYSVDLLSSRTYDATTGGLSADFDHLALLVDTEAGPHLVDVGWGDGPLRPLPAEPGQYEARPRPACIETNADAIRLLELVERVDGQTVWELQYEAARAARTLSDFDPRSRYLQTEPGLNWTEKPLATRATSAAGGRVTLHADRLRVRQDDLTFTDTPVAPGEWAGVLRDQLGLDPP